METDKACDVLFDGQEFHIFEFVKIHTRNTHGTGCTLSSAIASYLGQGMDTVEAVDKARQYIYTSIHNADRLCVGHGHGPVHHFHKYW